MTNTYLIDSIAYCGLICKLCFLSEKCDGCKTENNICNKNLSEKGCPQKECCTKKKINGCWECKELKICNLGIYSNLNSLKVKAFSLYIQKNGLTKFINSIVRNIDQGISVEKGKDYDNLSIECIHNLLETGEKPLS